MTTTDPRTTAWYCGLHKAPISECQCGTITSRPADLQSTISTHEATIAELRKARDQNLHDAQSLLEISKAAANTIEQLEKENAELRQRAEAAEVAELRKLLGTCRNFFEGHELADDIDAALRAGATDNIKAEPRQKR